MLIKPMELFCFEKVSEPRATAAVIVAAGSFSRMNGVNKQFAELLGIPVIARTMLCFEHCPEISSIVVVAREEDIPEIQRLAIHYEVTKLRAIAAGGSTRRESVEKGVEACPADTAYYAIHDGARPLASQKLIAEAVHKAWETGAAAPAVAMKDTVKQARGGIVTGTPERSTLFAVQTPQVFESELFIRAIAKAKITGEDATDDCTLCERVDHPVHLTQGEYRNLKITTPEDLAIAQALLLFEVR